MFHICSHYARRVNLSLMEGEGQVPQQYRTYGHAAHFKRIVRVRREDQAMRQVTPTLWLQQASCEQDEKGGSIDTLHTDSQPMSVAYLEKLNPEQRRAVEHGVRDI